MHVRKCNLCNYESVSVEELNKHVSALHTDEVLFQCTSCDFHASSNDILKYHIDTEHIQGVTFTAKVEEPPKDKPQPKVVNGKIIACPFCDLESKNPDELKTHIANIHIKPKDALSKGEIQIEASELCSTCSHCSFNGNKTEMEKHLKSRHAKKLDCEVCGNCFVDDKTLNNHIQAKHARSPEVDPFPCERCGLVMATFPLLQEHVNIHHKSITMQCKYCGFSSENEESQQEHLITNHEEYVILHTMAKQVDTLTDSSSSSDNFKADVLATLRTILENQNIMRQELFLVRNNTTKNGTQPREEPAPAGPSAQPAGQPCPPPGPRSTPSPTGSNPSTPTSATQAPPPPCATIPPQDEPSKILYIGDSISHNVNADL